MLVDVSTADLLKTGNPLYGDYNFNAYNNVIFPNNTRNVAADVLVQNNYLVATCSDWTVQQWSNFTFVYEACGDLQTISDIEGVGVMEAFVLTCAIVLFACVGKGLCMFFIVDEEGNLIKNFRERFYDIPPKSQRRARKINKTLGKIILGLADQQMVTGFAIIIAGWHLYSGTSAYNFYVVSHLAAFAILTQSVAFLVLFDVLHKSLLLHSLRVLLYALTLFLFYYNAWYSYDLTGNEGYRAACPATCRFKSSSATWGGIIAAGAPVYMFIVVDLLRKVYRRWKEGKNKHKPHRLNIIFRSFRVLAWITCIIDFWYSWITVSTSSQLISYGGLIDSPTYDLNTWGFGQLVAMILVVLPLLTALQEWKDEQDEDKKRDQGLDRLGQRLSLEREERNIALLERQSQIPLGARDQSYETPYKGFQSTVNQVGPVSTTSLSRPQTNATWDSSEDATYAPPRHEHVKQPRKTRRHREEPSLGKSSKAGISFYQS